MQTRASPFYRFARVLKLCVLLVYRLFTFCNFRYAIWRTSHPQSVLNPILRFSYAIYSSCGGELSTRKNSVPIYSDFILKYRSTLVSMAQLVRVSVAWWWGIRTRNLKVTDRLGPCPEHSDIFRVSLSHYRKKKHT